MSPAMALVVAVGVGVGFFVGLGVFVVAGVGVDSTGAMVSAGVLAPGDALGGVVPGTVATLEPAVGVTVVDAPGAMDAHALNRNAVTASGSSLVGIKQDPPHSV